MSLVITLAVVACITVSLTRWTSAHQKGPPRESINRSVRRLSDHHRGEPGMIVDVLWPTTWLYAPKPTVHSISIFERSVVGEIHRLSRHVNNRRRAVWVPLKGGGRRRLRCVASGEVASTTQLEVNVGHDGHAFVTCWPAKRRLVTPARVQTDWAVDALG